VVSVMRKFKPEEGTDEEAWATRLKTTPIAALDLEVFVRRGLTVHVVAPHPDDEILGAGGLLQRFSRLGARAIIHALTDGEASHPNSAMWPRLKLIQTRREESLEALRTLKISFERRRLLLPDGALPEHESTISSALRDAVSENDVVIAPWRFDGHPDHEAAGRAARDVAAERRAHLLETPIWGWNRSAPNQGEMPLDRARRLDLEPEEQRRKAEAIARFRSQTDYDLSTGRPPILSSKVLAHFRRPYEVVFHDQL